MPSRDIIIFKSMPLCVDKVDHACFAACLIILFCKVRVSDKIFLKAILEADAEINEENEV